MMFFIRDMGRRRDQRRLAAADSVITADSIALGAIPLRR